MNGEQGKSPFSEWLRSAIMGADKRLRNRNGDNKHEEDYCIIVYWNDRRDYCERNAPAGGFWK